MANLIQPERFKVVLKNKEGRLDFPIVSVKGTPKNMKDTLGLLSDHAFALDAQFVGPVRLKKHTTKDSKGKVVSPNLKPETIGKVKLGNVVGKIKIGKKIHPLFDYIEIDATPSYFKDDIIREKFNKGGKLIRVLKSRQQKNKGGLLRKALINLSK